MTAKEFIAENSVLKDINLSFVYKEIESVMEQYAKQQATKFCVVVVGGLRVEETNRVEITLLPATIDKRYELFLNPQAQVKQII